MRFLLVIWMVGLAGCVSVNDSDISDSDRAQRVQTLTTLALGYIEQGSFDLAVQPLQRALQLDPSDQEAMLAQAVMLERQGDSDQADQAYVDLFKRHPDFTRGRQIYANYLFSAGRTAEACQALDQVVSDTLFAARAQAFENLGQCRERLGEASAAIAAYERAHRLDTRRPLPNLALAEDRFLQGEVQQAAFHFTQFQRAAQQSARSLWIGIRIADAIGDRASQEKYEQALSQQYPDTPEYSRWLKWQS